METYPEAGVGLCGLSDAHLSLAICFANPCVPIAYFFPGTKALLGRK